MALDGNDPRSGGHRSGGHPRNRTVLTDAHARPCPPEAGTPLWLGFDRDGGQPGNRGGHHPRAPRSGESSGPDPGAVTPATILAPNGVGGAEDTRCSEASSTPRGERDARKLRAGSGTADRRGADDGRAGTSLGLRRTLEGYAVALGASSLALLLRAWLAVHVGPGLPTYVTSYPAVMLTAMLYGLGPGLVATATSAALVYSIHSPMGAFSIENPVDLLGLSIFSSMGLALSLTADRYRRTRDRAAAYAQELGVQVERQRLVEEVARERDRARTLAKEAQLRADELDAVFNAIGEAVIVCDAEGTVIKANRAAVALYGFNPIGVDCATRQTIVNLRYPDGRPVPGHELPTRRAERGERFQDERFLQITAEGASRTIQCSAVPLLDDNGVAGTVVVWQDITVREQAEAALRRAHTELETRVQERTADLQRLTGELAIAEQQERTRISHVLHDGLQQHLVAARLRVVLAERADFITAETAQEVRGQLDQAISLTRSLSAELSPTVLDTHGLLPALDWLVSHMRETHHFTVELKADAGAEPGCETGRVVLFHAVRELLFNAVKHAGVPRATVEAVCWGGEVQITVADEGAGFDTAQLRPTARTGIGLSSIRQRLEFLGGSLDVVSAPGRGSRFRLTVPQRPPRRPPAAPDVNPD